VSHNLVLDYVSYLSNAQLVLPARRCDIVGKKIFDIGEKYYFEDLGLRHALVGFRATDIDKIGERLYVQVAYNIPNDKVRDREFGNLMAIPDNFPKKMVFMDEITGGTYNGIDHIHLEDFLLSL
jgi:predicted AAA+ superfamily ATPase